MATASAALLVAVSAAGAEPDESLRTATQQVQVASAKVVGIERTIQTADQKKRTAEERLADAMLLVGVKDYERAINLLSQIVEVHQDHRTAYADGLNLLGEAYFLSKQYTSARRIFLKIYGQRTDPRFQRFRERAAMRLVDVALRTGDLDGVDTLIASMGTPSPQESGLAYAKGKGLIALGRLGEASAALQGVEATSKWAHQARYLQGVIAMRQALPPEAFVVERNDPEGAEAPPAPRKRASRAQLAKAIALFEQVTRLNADTAEHAHVIDLAWLAIGRLLYEARQWTESVQAYNRIDRGSPEFGTMLYELAWVYVKLGDVVRARRALEVLAVVAPDSEDVADAALLRGDLLLRSGQFAKSKKVYLDARGTYEDVQQRLARFLASSSDPKVFFQTMRKDQMELFEAGPGLPPLVMKWARNGTDGQRAFAIVDDLVLCRRLVKESNQMVERLNAVLSSPNRIRAIPELRAGAEEALGLLNTVGLARLRIGQGLSATSDDLAPALAQVRAQRESLERRLAMIPATPDDFAAREKSAQKQWNTTSQALQRLELEVDQLQATTNGLERMLRDSSQAGVVRNPQQVQQLNAQLTEQRTQIRLYRNEIEQLRNQVEAGRVQVGFGDARFVEDAQVRRQYAQLLDQEVALSQQGQGGRELAAYAARALPVLAQARATDARVDAALAKIDRAVQVRIAKLRELVRRETINVAHYSVQLEKLDGEAQVLVGEVARRNFEQVGQRLGDIVLRADVGVTEQAWELREEQKTRVQRLKVERALIEQRLGEELNDVLDDGVELE
ncbi:MAG: tetratricopeptide repeat protein [Myxococcota bacterium]